MDTTKEEINWMLEAVPDDTVTKKRILFTFQRAFNRIEHLESKLIDLEADLRNAANVIYNADQQRNMAMYKAENGAP